MIGQEGTTLLWPPTSVNSSASCVSCPPIFVFISFHNLHSKLRRQVCDSHFAAEETESQRYSDCLAPCSGKEKNPGLQRAGTYISALSPANASSFKPLDFLMGQWQTPLKPQLWAAGQMFCCTDFSVYMMNSLCFLWLNWSNTQRV